MVLLRSRRLALAASALLLAGAFWLAISPAHAQVFGPPMTIFGSVTDAAGPVADGLPVEAYIGDQVCGRGATQYTGDGDGRVTVYWADVVAKEQTSGCGYDGAAVRVKIGERFAESTAQWKPGPVQLDVTFGGATPAAIPTFTPTPKPTQAATTAPGDTTPVPGQAGTAASGTPQSTAAGRTATTGPTLKGGLVSNSSANRSSGGGGDSGGGNGVPIWAIVVIVLGVLAALGGGVGFAMARGQRRNERDLYPGDVIDR